MPANEVGGCIKRLKSAPFNAAAAAAAAAAAGPLLPAAVPNNGGGGGMYNGFKYGYGYGLVVVVELALLDTDGVAGAAPPKLDDPDDPK